MLNAHGSRRLLVTSFFAALALLPRVAVAASPAPTEPSPSPADATSAAPPAPAPPPEVRPWFVHLNVGVPVYTTIGSWTNPLGANVSSQSFTPTDRFALVQLVGAGYWVHPNIRLNLSLQFAEMLTSQPANPAKPAGPTTLTGLTFMSAIAWAAFTYGPLFVGVGPMAGPRWMGNSATSWVFGDVGIFSCLGASIPLGSGFALGLAVQAPVTFNPAVNFTIVPALSIARRF